MTDTYTLTVRDELGLAQHEMLRAGAWATGFCVANDLVDTGLAQTRDQVLAGIPGINLDNYGHVISFAADIVARYDFPWANSQDFVAGVKASVEANISLLGGQNV